MGQRLIDDLCLTSQSTGIEAPNAKVCVGPVRARMRGFSKTESKEHKNEKDAVGLRFERSPACLYTVALKKVGLGSGAKQQNGAK